MRKYKLIAAMLAALFCTTSVTTPASAGFYFPVYKKFWFFKHFKHIKHVKKVKVHGGHNHTGVVWTIIGCAGGVVLAALAANARDHRELTANEAASCGLLFLFSPPNNPL
jgi:hypothetical protein